MLQMYLYLKAMLFQKSVQPVHIHTDGAAKLLLTLNLTKLLGQITFHLISKRKLSFAGTVHPRLSESQLSVTFLVF